MDPSLTPVLAVAAAFVLFALVVRAVLQAALRPLTRLAWLALFAVLLGVLPLSAVQEGLTRTIVLVFGAVEEAYHRVLGAEPSPAGLPERTPSPTPH